MNLNDTSQVHPQLIKPIFLRDKQAVLMYGLSRSKLYQLSKEGKITSISLQEAGTARGTRLFEVASIEKYINSFRKNL